MSDKKLASELEAQAMVDFNQGRKNHLSDLTFAIGAIATSFVATVLVATHTKPEWVAASVAALPGLCASLQRIIDFRGRSAWYFLRAARLEGIARALKHEGMQESDASRKFTEIEIEMENKWSEFVKSGGAPAKPV